MVVVVMADQDEVDRRQVIEADARRVDAFGPAKDSGETRSDQTGSVRMFSPATWMSRVAWPTMVTRNRSREIRASGTACRRGSASGRAIWRGRPPTATSGDR